MRSGEIISLTDARFEREMRIIVMESFKCLVYLKGVSVV